MILWALCGISKAGLCNAVISVDHTTIESFQGNIGQIRGAAKAEQDLQEPPRRWRTGGGVVPKDMHKRATCYQSK
jgi:hypothetical protein